MSTPIPGIKYTYAPSTQEWVSPGRPSLPFTISEPEIYSPTNNPTKIKLTESVYDNMPAGVTVVNITDYSSSHELYEALQEVATTVSQPVYVQLEATNYTISTLVSYSTNDWRGWANSNKRVMGLIGHGPDQTFITVQPTAVSSSAGARDFVLNATNSAPVSPTALYFSNDGTSVPLFISGITFRGTLQTPYGVYSAASQSYFRINQTASSPLAWNGMSIWRGNANARMQYCRFQGFGFALNTAPPFECGAINSNRCTGMTFYRCEWDGRIAAEIDSSQPRASGGLMWNKESSIFVVDSWLHHTRRSGWATNTNTGSTTEAYTGTNFQLDEIANQPNDGWAGDNGGFNGSNVEVVLGTFRYNNIKMNVAMGSHIAYAVAYSGSPGIYQAPDHPVIIVRNGFTTNDTLYGGCLRISVSKQPNSTGISPVWTKLNQVGIEASGFFDIQNAAGTKMTGVKYTDWNSTMTPDQYYVVRY